MFLNSEREIIFPKSNEPVGLFFPVLIYAQVDLGSFAVDELCYLTGRVKRFSISKIIYQLRKILCHFVRVSGRCLLVPEPAFTVFFYKKRFPQCLMVSGCKILENSG